MIFTRDQVALIQSGRMTATLVRLGDVVKPGTVRALRQRVLKHDGDGNELGWQNTTLLGPADPETGERERRVITISAVLVADFHAGEDSSYQLTDTDASNCGYRSLEALKGWWASEHPGGWLCRLVRFENGDTRDQPRLLARVGGYTTVPALTVDHEAEAVTAVEQRALTMVARARDRDRVADPDIRLYRELAKALEYWETETGGRAATRDAHVAIRGIRDQLRSLDRRLKAA